MGWYFAAVLSVLTAQIAIAYPTPVDFDGRPLRWNITATSGPISYEIVADEPFFINTFSDIVSEAAQMWTDVETSYVSLAPVAENETAKVTVNLQSVIEGGAYAAGYASFDAYEPTEPPQPNHCSVFVAITSDQSYYSISKTILHELGHCLGLGHTLVPEAIMSYSLDKNSFALDTDDAAGITRLYPQDGQKPALAPGCAVGSFSQTADARRAWPTLLILLIPLSLSCVHSRVSRKKAINY